MARWIGGSTNQPDPHSTGVQSVVWRGADFMNDVAHSPTQPAMPQDTTYLWLLAAFLSIVMRF